MALAAGFGRGGTGTDGPERLRAPLRRQFEKRRRWAPAAFFVFIRVMKKPILTLLALLFVASGAPAADITGKWWVDTSAATKGQGGRGGSVFGGEFEFKVSVKR